MRKINQRSSKFNQKQSFKRIVYSAMSLLILIFLLFFVLNLRVKDIVCLIDDQTCPDFINQQIQLVDENIIFFDIEGKVKNQLIDLPIELISVQRILPNKLIIHLNQSKQRFILEFSDQSVAVDEKGNIFPIVNQDDLFRIKVSDQIYQALVNDLKLNDGFAARIVYLIEEIERKNLKIVSIEYKSFSTIILNIEGFPRVLLSPDEMDRQIDDLFLLKNEVQFGQLEKEIREIDMRFDFPILREFESQI